MRKIFKFTLVALLAHSLCAQDAPKPDASPAPKPAAEEERMPEVRDGKVTIAGKEVPYSVTTSKINLVDDKGKPKASIFNIAYTRSDVKETSDRPVMFAFNGGPGSSSVWLHLGILGPKLVDFPGDGTEAMVAPARLIDNPHSLLDVCDLVFIDPVSTGYSRTEKDVKADQFHGVEGDIESVGDFIRMWLTENKRWGSPKYLLGESYGGIRAAGLSQHLQSRYGMSLNGVVLLSSLLDFNTIIPSQGAQLSHLIFLPAYTSTALHHGKIDGDHAELVASAREYAFGDYSLALLKGSELPPEELEAAAEKLSGLTGISKGIWKRNQLRLSPSEFRIELLREEGKVIGRFDSRVAWDATDPTSSTAEYDPSYSVILGAFSTAMLDYLSKDLGWTEPQPYEILTSKVHPWSWDANNRVLNLTGRLATAVRDNPKLKVLVMGAHNDLATPGEGVPYSIRQMVHFPANLRDRISYTWYQSGHMFYLNPPDLEKARKDLLEFLEQ